MPIAQYEILVAGNVNVETHLAVPGFPLDYAKFRAVDFQLHDGAAGVALNVAASLARLGHRTALAGLVGDDSAGALLADELRRFDLSPTFLCKGLKGTARSVILTDPEGESAIFSDLKDVQACEFPVTRLEGVLDEVQMVYIGNVNWTLPLGTMAHAWGKKVATDVHHIRSLDDDYNARFLELADIVFLSGEQLEASPEETIHRLWEAFDVSVVVCGLGAEGAMVGDRSRGRVVSMPAPSPSHIVSTVGAGDALGASFLSGILQGMDAAEALHRAQVYAGHKCGHPGATSGLLDRAGLDALL